MESCKDLHMVFINLEKDRVFGEVYVVGFGK